MGIVAAMVDSREPDWVQSLTFGGAPTSVVALDAGDLLLSTEDGVLLCIERKTTTDLLGSLKDERLWSQLHRMRQVTPWTYLAIVGDLQPGPNGKCHANGRETGWNWASVQGSLLTVQELGVHILHVANDHDYEAAIIRLANRDRQPLRIQPARDNLMVSDAEAVLLALPGIGIEKAKALLAWCGTPSWVLTYLTDDEWDGAEAPNIGPGTKRRIRRALDLPDWAQLAVVVKETGMPVAHDSRQEAVAV